MRVNIKKALTFSLVFFMAGCGANSAPDLPEENNLQQTLAIKYEPDEYSLFYNHEYPLSLYEPETGCYIGAYVLSNREINFDIKQLDEMTEKEHALSVYNLNAGKPFPDKWVISSIAAKKTPYFVLTPPNEYDPYDYSLIDSLAEQFGEFYVPMFVEFYPLSGSTSDTKAYINFYRHARKKFREKASNTAFVWAVDAKDAADSNRYYPGDAYVDWIGLHSIQTLEKDGYGADFFSALDYLYYTYQKVKPIAVSQLAVSHYTNTDYIYKNQIAADELRRIYNRIIDYYPRVKMINYLDYDEKASDSKIKIDYYTVTENRIVLTAYKEAISDSRFLSTAVLGLDSQQVIQMIRSPFPVLKIGEYWYASEYSFKYDLNTKGSMGERLINGRKYYNMNFFIKNSSRSLIVDDEAQILTLSA